MCTISDNIKFCSCSGANVDDSNYWTIYRRKEGCLKVGQTIYHPNTLHLQAEELGKLLNKLNEEELFDFEYEPKENDKLEINLKQAEQTAQHSFVFFNGKWKAYHKSDSSELLDDLELNQPPYISHYKGVIKHPLKEN